MSKLHISSDQNACNIIRFGLWLNKKINNTNSICIYDTFCQLFETNENTGIVLNKSLTVNQIKIVKNEYTQLNEKFDEYDKKYMKYIENWLEENNDVTNLIVKQAKKMYETKLQNVNVIKAKLNAAYVSNLKQNIENMRKMVIRESGILTDLKLNYEYLNRVWFTKGLYKKILTLYNPNEKDVKIDKNVKKSSKKLDVNEFDNIIKKSDDIIVEKPKNTNLKIDALDNFNQDDSLKNILNMNNNESLSKLSDVEDFNKDDDILNNDDGVNSLNLLNDEEEEEEDKDITI